MEPWWVYGLVALVCVMLVVMVKIVEMKFLDEEDFLINCVKWGLIIIGGLAALGMLVKLSLLY